MEIPDFLYISATWVGGRIEAMSQKGSFLRLIFPLSIFLW